MHEHIQRGLYYFEVHLLFASIVFCAAWVLTSIRWGSATAKYWIWVATLLNFILPLGAAVDKLMAPHLLWARPLAFIGEVGVGIAQNAPVAVVWSIGLVAMAARLCLRILSDRRAAQATVSQAHNPNSSYRLHGVLVSFSGRGQTPAVGGVLHPHILLPDGIDRVLSRSELDAVLIHELTHARRRDNLIRLIYEAALCALWFHPFVWITGSRLAVYRELSCDEPVIAKRRGGDLISALAKLAGPQAPLLLQATASSFMGHRLARLAAQPGRHRGLASTLLAVLFSAIFLGGIFVTVAHTACCFVPKI
jgi:beta-lactamase regulating signal transducer with metallopeptidase domain